MNVLSKEAEIAIVRSVNAALNEVIDNQKQESRDIMNQEQACHYLQIGPETLRDWETRGLKVIQVDKKAMYSKELIHEFLMRHVI